MHHFYIYVYGCIFYVKFSFIFHLYRLERQRKPDKPEDFVCYSDSESEEDTPSQQQQILRTSYNFVDYVCAREIQTRDVIKHYSFFVHIF